MINFQHHSHLLITVTKRLTIIYESKQINLKKFERGNKSIYINYVVSTNIST